MRVSSKEVAVPPFDDSYQVGETARTTLKVRSSNEPNSHFALTYQIPEGSGRFLIDGVNLLPGKAMPFLQGDDERTATLTYVQNEPGPARIVLTLTDTYGYVTQSELSTRYEQSYRTVHFWIDYENQNDGTVKVRAGCDSEDFPDLVAVQAAFKVRYIPKGNAPARSETLTERFTLTDTHTLEEKTLSVGANNSYSGIMVLSDRDISITGLAPSQSTDGQVVYKYSN